MAIHVAHSKEGRDTTSCVDSSNLPQGITMQDRSGTFVVNCVLQAAELQRDEG